MDLTNRMNLTLYIIGCCLAFCTVISLGLCIALRRFRRAWSPKAGVEILSKLLANFEDDDELHEEQAKIRHLLKDDDGISHFVLAEPQAFARFCLAEFHHLPQGFKPYAHLLFD